MGGKVLYHIKGIIWMPLNYGSAVDIISCEEDSRNDALKLIDKNFDGNTKQQTIEFEYINKP